MSRLHDYLCLAGKGDRKVFAVFAVSRDSAASAVRHLRAGSPEIPVWLFTTATPDPEVASVCENLVLGGDSLALLVDAEKLLWPYRVALSVATWTGSHGRWPAKLAPLLVPPFRALVLNEHGDFFNATPRAVARHLARRVRDAAHSSWNRLKDLNRGLWLWLFALVAQRFTLLSRGQFRKWGGGEPLVVPQVAPQGSGVVCFRHAQRHWIWGELDRLVRSSEARHILFLERGADANPEEMLPLFEDPRTFAVSRQVDYRDWKEGLFATAPFRQLQPGEASQTLAPVSTAILVDRAKLAAMGVPRTVVPGTAWLLIFWKAAAAGWRSYSVGGSSPLKDSPDWPYEEAEFVTRVLSDSALRALGPRERDLARGTIAFNPKLARPFRGLPRVLVVSPYLPWPLSHGGAVRIFNLCRALSDRVDFVLACFREKGEVIDYERLRTVFRRVYVVDRDERASLDPALPSQVREHVSRSMSALLTELCREHRVDLAQVEFTHLAGFREAVPRTVPAILVEHDLTFALFHQFARHTSAHGEYERWLAFERKWLRSFDAVWTMSPEDRASAIAVGSPQATTFMVPNGVDLERFAAQPPAGGGEILYVGSFRHQPNILGFQMLRQEVMPRVWNRIPQARLRVVAGPDPERYGREFQKSAYPRDLDPRIVVHGFVEDLRPLYGGAAVVVVPLVVSAGTNIKVMEAMACARPIVSTPIGCAGLGLVDGRDLLVRPGWPEFAQAVCELLDDPELRGRLGAQARRTVEQRYIWNAIADEAFASYSRLWTLAR